MGNFIGNATLLDTLYTHYSEPFQNYENGKYECKVNQAQFDSLEEIQSSLDGEIISLSLGVEAIGHLLSIADYKDMGIDNKQLVHLGWMLAKVGKQLASCHNLHDRVTESIEKSVIKE